MPEVTRHTEPQIRQRSVASTSAHYLLYLQEELVYFRGHFPRHPVVPGVVQVRWAVSMAKPLGLPPILTTMERLKFTRLMTPGTELWLELNEAGPGRVDFRYQNAEGTFSSGRLCHQAG